MDWGSFFAGLGTFLLTAGGGVVIWMAKIRKDKADDRAKHVKIDHEARRQEIELDQEAESYAIKQLRTIIRDMEQRVAKDAAECEKRIQVLHNEIRELRDAERKSYAEAMRLGAVIKIMEEQIHEMKASLRVQGIEVKTDEHRKLPPPTDPGDQP